MAHDAQPASLRLLLAELENECQRVQQLVDQFEHAATALRDSNVDRLLVYGAAALLESFYTGVEKALDRIASKMGGMPSGPAWHRELLTSMTLDIEGVRPRVLSRDAARELDTYLAFRHRFRNLYVFDLEQEPMLQLLERGPKAWQLVSTDLKAFFERVRGLIAGLESE